MQNYSNFQIYSSNLTNPDSEYRREWYSKVLLIKKQPEVNLNESMIQTPESPSYINQQATFAEGLNREYREFRLIEIMNEHDVIEHLRFIHPLIYGLEQKFYFDIKNQYMLERQNN